MPYQAERDATISKVIGTSRNAEGEKVAHYESVTYPAGSVVFEQNIAPHVLRRLEHGDDHLSSLLSYIDEAEARQLMGEQIQAAASQPVGEEEILHQEERLGSEGTIPPSPGVDPAQVEEPPYEAPPAGVGDSGASVGEVPEEVVTDDQTVGQGTGTPEDGTTVEEASEGASESEGETTEEPGEQTESEESADTIDEGQQNEQDQSDEVQEKSSTDESDQESSSEGNNESNESETEDQFSGLDKKTLLEAAKAAQISGRTKMDEDQLRAALRGKAK
jgi:hypothetical protein